MTRAPDVAQLGKIAARIESSHDGEALAAARMLVKRLGGHGLRLSEIVERGINAANAGFSLGPAHPRPRPSPPPATHRVKIDALLDDAIFTGDYLTRRSINTLRAMRKANYLDPIETSWVDGLLEKARDIRAGRRA